MLREHKNYILRDMNKYEEEAERHPRKTGNEKAFGKKHDVQEVIKTPQWDKRGKKGHGSEPGLHGAKQKKGASGQFRCEQTETEPLPAR